MRDNLYEYYATSPRVQGDVGEVVIASELRNKCNMDILRNVYVPYKGHYTEIDMVALSNKGVFIIESKNYSGEVIGSVKDKYWSVRYGYSRYEKLYNPILQNLLHKEAVLNFITERGIDSKNIFRPVIFGDKARLRLSGCEKLVFTLSSFIDTYNGLDLHSTNIDAFNCLKPLSNPSDEMRLLHLGLLKSEDG